MTAQPLPDHLHRTLVEWIDAGKKFALVTVLKDAGSTPRKAGTKALVDADGQIWGTIGGGLLESEARRVAGEALRTGVPVAFDFRFGGASARGDDPVCGGVMRILIDPDPDKHRHAFATAASELGARRRGVMATRVAGSRPAIDMVWCRARSNPPWGGAASTAVGEARATDLPRYFNDAESEGLAEPVAPRPLLLVAGGGHVGRALARQAALLDFDVVVTDDRPEFAQPGLYPPGVEVHCGRFRELLPRWPVNRDTYVAVVGRGHKVDGDALAAVIHEPAGYVGMMGSRRKVALVRREFVESGIATAEQFDRVHAPIGLDLGAQTVEEIAASIVAELVAARRGRDPRAGARGAAGGAAGAAGG